MRKHAIVRDDGSVAIMTVYPQAVVIAGVRFAVLSQSGDVLLIGNPGGPVQRTTLADLVASGATVVYPTVEDEIAKWPATERTRVAAKHAVTTDQIPSDRTTRNQWRYRDGRVAPQMQRQA